MSSTPLIALLVTEPLYNGLEDTITEIPMDARLSSNYRFTAQPTRFPIESGSKITDHVHLDPEEITVEGLVSDTPVLEIPTTLQLRGDAAGVASGNRQQGAYDALHTVWKNRLLVTAVTEYDVFESMVLTSFECPRSIDDQGFHFTATLQTIITVESQIGQLPPDVVARLKRRSKKRRPTNLVDKKAIQKAQEIASGKVSPTEADPKSTTKAQAVAARPRPR